MTCTAIVDRFVSSKVRRNSLTVVEKYHFDDYDAACFFAVNLKRIDKRVIRYSIKEF